RPWVSGRCSPRRSGRGRLPRETARGGCVMSRALFALENVEAGYDDALVVRGVNLEADQDEIVSIIGPNGAGKTTLLKAAYGLLPLAAGRVLLAGEDVSGLRPDRLTRRGLNLVPQSANVFPMLTIAENLHVG